MFLLVFVYFALLRLTSALQFERLSNNELSTDCRTLTGGTGNCVSVEECPELVEQAHRTGSFAILKRANCGFDKSTPKVCCPITTTETPQTTGTTNTPNIWWPSGPGTTEAATDDSTKWNDSIINHPNYNLLPHDDCGPATVENKVFGGEKTQEFPWMVLLQYKTVTGRTLFQCGGALISDRYVLTAAHCVKGLMNMYLSSVRLGEYDHSKDKDCFGDECAPPVQDIPLEEIIPHARYFPRDPSKYNDIALLRLKTRASLNKFVQPICIPASNMLLRTRYEGRRMTVAGWGKTTDNDDSDSSVKLKVEVPVVSNEECREFYERNRVQLKDTQMCAGGEPGKDSCQGDSGGPLMSADVVDRQLKYYITGIVSFGPEDCGTYAGVYTKVSEFVPWILDNINN